MEGGYHEEIVFEWKDGKQAATTTQNSSQSTKPQTTTNYSSQPQTPVETPKNEPKQDIDLTVAKTMLLTFGKYNGKTLEEVIDTDEAYVEWLAENAQKEIIRQSAKILLDTLPY